MIKKKTKGQYGYLQYKKVIQLLMTFGCMLIVGIIILSGFFYYGNIKNTFTVIGIVTVIPAAKFIVGYIVLIPYKVPQIDLYEILKSDSYILLSNLVITSEEKIVNVDFAAIKNKRAYCYISNKRTDINYASKYLKKILNSEFDGVAVKVFTDFDKFDNAANSLKNLESDITDKRISELMCIYSM